MKPQTDPYIKQLVKALVLPEEARDMYPQDALDAYNDAHDLHVGDDGYLIHPDVVETTQVIDGVQRRAWTLQANRNVTADKPCLRRLQGIDRAGSDLGFLS